MTARAIRTSAVPSYALAFAPDGRRFAYAASDDGIFPWQKCDGIAIDFFLLRPSVIAL